MSKVFLPFMLLGGLAAQGQDTQAKRGEEVYRSWCFECHGDGAGKPGTMALAAKYKDGRPPVLDQRTDLAPAVTKAFVRKGVSIMPIFRKTEISDMDLDALALYLARNNKK